MMPDRATEPAPVDNPAGARYPHRMIMQRTVWSPMLQPAALACCCMAGTQAYGTT